MAQGARPNWMRPLCDQATAACRAPGLLKESSRRHNCTSPLPLSPWSVQTGEIGNTCTGTWVTLSCVMMDASRGFSMTWKETSAVTERLAFCEAAGRPERNMAALCREYKISRKTGYKWLKRAAAAEAVGVALAQAVQAQTRRPHTNPNQTPAEVEAAVLAVRKAHPTWGGRKIHHVLRQQGLGQPELLEGAVRRLQLQLQRQLSLGSQLSRQPAPSPPSCVATTIWTQPRVCITSPMCALLWQRPTNSGRWTSRAASCWGTVSFVIP